MKKLTIVLLGLLILILALQGVQIYNDSSIWFYLQIVFLIVTILVVISSKVFKNK